MVRAREFSPGNRAMILRIVLERDPVVCTTQFLTVDPRDRPVTEADWSPIEADAVQFDFLVADELARGLGVHAHALVISGCPNPNPPPLRVPARIAPAYAPAPGADSAPAASLAHGRQRAPHHAPRHTPRPVRSADGEAVKLFGYDPFND